MIRKLSGSLRQYKKQAILTPLLITGEVIMECLIPYIMAMLVNAVKDGCELAVTARYGVLLFFMACVSLLFGALAGSTCATASAGFARNLRHDLYYKIQTFSFSNIDRFSSASLVTRLTTDVSNVQFSFMMIIRTAVRSPLMFIFSVIMAFKMGGKLALMFVVIIPLLLLGLFAVAKKAMPLFRSVFRKYDKLNESIEENVMAMRVVKSFVREEHEKQKFDNAAQAICKDFTKAERIVALTEPLMQVCVYLNMLFVLTLGSYLIVSTSGASLDVGQLSAMLTYGIQILISLNMLSMIYVMITFSAESAHRIVEVLQEEPALRSPENAIETVSDGTIEFQGVSFKYSEHAERYALENIDLYIRSGETVGILGGTGSSKTTLVQLISRFYDVSDGAVLIGGVDVRRYDLTALRNRVAVVLQKNELFSGSIAENLRWGNAEATEEELREACRLAQADDFICSFPDGYNTRIEQGGTNVSGGQKQRLCIARALLKKPKILILDDSTSAVDTRTDAMIRTGFRAYIPETTKIIIAQRVASVMDADQIILMDGGRIAARGTHDELMKTNAVYRDIYTSQTKGGEENA